MVQKADQVAGKVEAERRVREGLHRAAEGVAPEPIDKGIGQFVLQTSPVGESQANGAAENIKAFRARFARLSSA